MRLILAISRGALAPGNYTLFSADVANAYAGLDFSGNTIISGLAIGAGLEGYAGSSVNISGNDIVLTIVVPESTSVSMLVATLGISLGLRRFRRRRGAQR
jgi:hypothetical protein